MSSRGALHGALATLLVGFVTAVFAITSPSFLVLRTELNELQCWQGEGIYTSRAYWGPDLSPGHPCRDVRKRYPGPLPTHEAYCLSRHHNSNSKHDDSSQYNREMCDATRTAKAAAVPLTGFTLAGPLLVFGLIQIKRTAKFARNQRLFLCVLYTSMLCSVCGLASMFVLAGAMFSSPLFSNAHVADLSREFNDGLPFTGGFSCAFQTPLHSLFSLFSSATMECVFPGPASCTLLLGMATQTLGVCFLFRFFVDMCAVPASVTMLRGASEVATPAQEEAFLREVSKRRRYSLYGAFRRRYAHMYWPLRLLVLNLLPTLSVLATIVSWLTYNLLGIQVIVITELSIVSNSQLGSYSSSSSSSSMAVDEATKHALMRQAQTFYNRSVSLPHGVFFKDVLNVFNFSPITSVKYFWLSNAYLIAGGVVIAVFVLPVGRAVLLIWFFFSPSKERFRGQMLSLMEWTGKYSLANLYLMCFLAIALTFRSNFIVIPLNLNESFLVHIRAGTNAGDGLGSYCFVATSILSLCIGQLYIQLHAFASYWEEDRRAADTLSPRRVAEEHEQEQQLEQPLLSAEQPDAVAAAAAPDQLEEGLVVPTLRTMARLSSTSNLALAGEGAGGGGSMRALREASSSSRADLWRALASHGSRTALDVVLPATAAVATAAAAGTDDEVSRRRRVDEMVPFHPFAEALCDRVFSPQQGVRIKFTPRGKVMSWIAMFVLVGFVLVCQSWDMAEIHQKGIAGDVIVAAPDRYKMYSLVSLTSAVARTGINVPAVELSFLFFIMTAMMPVLTVVGLAMMWAIPLTLAQQTHLFTWLEIASAWSSLDIFFVSVVGIYFELHTITEKILSDAVPNLSQLIRIFLPFEDGVMSADIRLLDGFWVLLTAVVLEKIAIYVVTESACQAITERRVEHFLRSFIKQQGGTEREASQMNLSELRTLLGDASQGLLETNAILAFAPMGRYASVAFPRYIYAGVPRTWWTNIGVRFGILADARTVDCYQKTGRWVEDMQEEEQDEERRAEEQNASFRPRSLSRIYASSGSAGGGAGGGGDDGWFF